MRPTDRDYCVSTIAVLQDQLRMIQDIASDMTMRLDELDETLLYAYAQKEDKEIDELMNDSWESGHSYAMWEKDKVVYDSSRKKECMCDACWGVTKPTDFYEPEDRGESKKEYLDWIDDVLRRTPRRAPQDYRMD